MRQRMARGGVLMVLRLPALLGDGGVAKGPLGGARGRGKSGAARADFRHVKWWWNP